MPNQPTAGVPSQSPIFPVSMDALQMKSKMGMTMNVPGLFYSQYTPTAATLSSGTVTNSGQSLVGALQLGGTTATTKPLGGDAAVTFSSSSGLLCSFTTSSFMPTTLNYNDFPVQFTTSASGVLPTGITANTTYYWQWVSATTGRLSLTPGGSVIAYTDAGTATIYCQAATQYYGSPTLPAGFLQASNTLNLPASTANSSGCMLHYEIMGHKIGTGTNNFTVTPGFIDGAGTFTAINAGNVQPAVNAGPFPFYIEGDIAIQLYGKTAAASPYSIANIRHIGRQQLFSTIATNTWATVVSAKTVTIDVTAGLTLDVRYIAATPAVAEYMEPLLVKYWVYN